MQNFRFGVSFAIFVLSAIGYAGQAAPEATKPVEKTAAPKQTTAGAVTVFVDPATGKIREPKPAEVEALTSPRAHATPQQTDDVKLLYGAHGAVGVKLGPESLNYVVYTKTADGKVSTQCVTGAEAAAKAVAGDASETKTTK